MVAAACDITACFILVATPGRTSYGQNLESLQQVDGYVHVPQLKCHCSSVVTSMGNVHLSSLHCLSVPLSRSVDPPVFTIQTTSIPPGRAPKHMSGWTPERVLPLAAVFCCAGPRTTPVLSGFLKSCQLIDTHTHTSDSVTRTHTTMHLQLLSKTWVMPSSGVVRL